MIKAVITHDYGQRALKAIEALGYEVTFIRESEIENTRVVNEAEVLICYTPFKRIDLDQMDQLKMIQLSSIGFDQVPVDKLLNRPITLCNNQGGYSKPMGEFVVGKVLEIYKGAKNMYKASENHQWKMHTDLLELVDKKILFLGTGTIAKESAKRLQGFEMEIYGANTTGHKVDYFDTCISFDVSKHLISEMDIVVVTLPATEKTQGLIDKRFLDKMKETAVLINVSRGSVIVETDLIHCLNEGKFLGVALDVVTHEPLTPSSPLWDFDNVYISSHSSWISERNNERRFEMIYENLRRYKEKEALNNQVDIARGY